MKILMLCWEYPPKISGGLGVAGKGLIEALAEKGHQITVLLPRIEDKKSAKNVEFIDLSRREIVQEKEQKRIISEEMISSVSLGKSVLPYLPPKYFKKETFKKVKTESLEEKEIQPDKIYEEFPLTGDYSDKTLIEIKLYALLTAQFVEGKTFDVVHCHDWMTLPAGKLTKELGFKTIGHVHSSEKERNGIYINPEISEIEKSILPLMDKLFTVSATSAAVISTDYKIKKSNISVIPNGIIGTNKAPSTGEKIGFIGRFTHQKAPSQFVDIARSLKSFDANLKFTMAGDGYLKNELEEKISQANLSGSLEMVGFIKTPKLKKWYAQLSVLIVPSNSEPFGLVALEAIQAGVAVIISKGAGITEFIPELIQVEHWNQHEFYMAAVKLLQDKKARSSYVKSCQKKANKLTWSNSASLTLKAYGK